MREEGGLFLRGEDDWLCLRSRDGGREGPLRWDRGGSGGGGGASGDGLLGGVEAAELLLYVKMRKNEVLSAIEKS